MLFIIDQHIIDLRVSSEFMDGWMFNISNCDFELYLMF